MTRHMSATFLGTSSGGGPVFNRNCSSLALDIAGNGSLWLVDCAEGTLRQFLLQPGPSTLRVNRVNKIFITHMHFDHTMGLVTLIANLLRGSAGTPVAPLSKPPLMHLYGPPGLRKFIRSTLLMTATTLTERYAVHELLTPIDEVTTCNLDELHIGETPGQDILCDPDTGLWVNFLEESGIRVDAANIAHRVNCFGYVFTELPHPSSPHHARKLVILGDTSDPSPILSLAHSPDLLIHEATDAYIPPTITSNGGNPNGAAKTPELVKEKTIMKGHSTPVMAGEIAKVLGARKLAMNHFSAKFPAPAHHQDRRRNAIMSEFERQASEAWGLGQAIAAYDYLRIDIPPRPLALAEDVASTGYEHASSTNGIVNGGDNTPSVPNDLIPSTVSPYTPTFPPPTPTTPNGHDHDHKRPHSRSHPRHRIYNPSKSSSHTHAHTHAESSSVHSHPYRGSGRRGRGHVRGRGRGWGRGA